MSLTVTLPNLFVDGVAFGTFVDPDTDVIVPKGVLVYGSSAGIRMREAGCDLTVRGMVSGGNAVQLGALAGLDSPPQTEHDLTVVAGAYISALDAAVTISGAGRVANAGTIQGDDWGVLGFIGAGGRLSVANTGTILSKGTAVEVQGTTGTLKLVNDGVMSGQLAWNSLGNLADEVVNRGVMTGAIQLGGGADRLVSTGHIEGFIFAGAGADIVNNGQGTWRGTGIDLGQGNDRFVNGRNAETVQGGDGRDTLDLRGSVGAVVSLENSVFNAGRAAGDVYFSFERILGSSAPDILFADLTRSTTLIGDAGDDSLSGSGRADRIEGGKGLDTLTGLDGADVFHIAGPSQGTDTITDFDPRLDTLTLRAAGFGAGLQAGSLNFWEFASQSTNVAASELVRLIFREGDTTLWFDRDGTGSAAPVKIADFQSGLALDIDMLLLV